MKKQEAINAMMRGEKVTHVYFDGEEWMTIQNGRYVFEDRVSCSFEQFWRHRTWVEWEEGWSIVKKKLVGAIAVSRNDTDDNEYSRYIVVDAEGSSWSPKNFKDSVLRIKYDFVFFIYKK